MSLRRSAAILAFMLSAYPITAIAADPGAKPKDEIKAEIASIHPLELASEFCTKMAMDVAGKSTNNYATFEKLKPGSGKVLTQVEHDEIKSACLEKVDNSIGAAVAILMSKVDSQHWVAYDRFRSSELGSRYLTIVKTAERQRFSAAVAGSNTSEKELEAQVNDSLGTFTSTEREALSALMDDNTIQTMAALRASVEANRFFIPAFTNEDGDRVSRVVLKKAAELGRAK